jgi:hypothetical protein
LIGGEGLNAEQGVLDGVHRNARALHRRRRIQPTFDARRMAVQLE